MSLNIINKNINSPFRLQRSIVDQGGSGGVYESGGYNPDAVYNNDAANAAMESFGKTVGAALSSRTEGDINKSNKETVERKNKRIENIDVKLNKKDTSENKKTRLENRKTRISKDITSTKEKISEYEKNRKLELKADINKID
jgi:hypothetical protein